MIASRITAIERKRAKQSRRSFYLFTNPTDADLATWSRIFDGRRDAPFILFFSCPGMARQLDPAPPEWPDGAIRTLAGQGPHSLGAPKPPGDPSGGRDSRVLFVDEG